MLPCCCGFAITLLITQLIAISPWSQAGSNIDGFTRLTIMLVLFNVTSIISIAVGQEDTSAVRPNSEQVLHYGIRKLLRAAGGISIARVTGKDGG